MVNNIEVLALEFREFCVSNLVVRHIEDIFLKAGFDRGDISRDRQISGTRRTLVEEFYGSIDWDNGGDIRKFLKAIENSLLLSFVDENQKEELRQLCIRCGFEVDQNGYTVYYTSRGVGKPVKNAKSFTNMFMTQFMGRVAAYTGMRRKIIIKQTEVY